MFCNEEMEYYYVNIADIENLNCQKYNYNYNIEKLNMQHPTWEPFQNVFWIFFERIICFSTFQGVEILFDVLQIIFSVMCLYIYVYYYVCNVIVDILLIRMTVQCPVKWKEGH